jgi:polysaccharide deacetylase 2 family uncharacterized protein YibQ
LLLASAGLLASADLLAVGGGEKPARTIAIDLAIPAPPAAPLPVAPSTDADDPERAPAADDPERAPAAAERAARPEPEAAGVAIGPAMSAAAFAAIDPAPAGSALTAAPDPRLVEREGGLELPRVSVEGTRPLDAYGRPFEQRDDRPRIVILLRGFGLSAVASAAAVAHLPAEVTFVLNPYAAKPAHWARQARSDGHEVLVGLPLEPAPSAGIDPGPLAVLAGAPAVENLQTLARVLGACPGCVGVFAALGGGFAGEAARLRPVLEAVQSRGLMLADGTRLPGAPLVAMAEEINLPRIWVDAAIDAELDAEAIDAALEDLVALAMRRGIAVGSAWPYPLTIARLAEWWPSLARRRIVLAPASAGIRTQLRD